MIATLALGVAVLGCTPSNGNAAGEQTEAPSFDEAMGKTADYRGEWLVNYETAKTIAGELKRPILINFTGSDWCGWCIRLHKEVFSQTEFTDYASKNLVLLKVDFPRSIPQTPEEKKINRQLAEDYDIEGYPTIILVNSEGKEINRTGYQTGGAASYVKHLQGLLATK